MQKLLSSLFIVCLFAISANQKLNAADTSAKILQPDQQNIFDRSPWDPRDGEVEKSEIETEDQDED